MTENKFIKKISNIQKPLVNLKFLTNKNIKIIKKNVSEKILKTKNKVKEKINSFDYEQNQKVLNDFILSIRNYPNRIKEKIAKIKQSWSDENDKYNQIKYQEIRYKPAPKWTRTLQWAIVGCVGFGFVYSVVARIDEVVITQGDLESQGAERPIKSPTNGIVSEIPVKEGQKVKEGQIILKFDQEINDSRILSIKNQLKSEELRLAEEDKSFEAKKDSLLSRLKSTLLLQETEGIILARYEALYKVGAVAELQMLQQQNKVININGEIEQLEARRRELFAGYLQNVEQIRKEISVLKRQLAETIKSQEYELFKSPIDGYVFGLVPSSPGYSANTGEIMMNIVPIGDVQAKVFVTNQDVGFLKEDMKAQIRVSAFPFTQFGEINGTLKLLGREVVQHSQMNPEPKFPVIVELDKQYLERKGKKYPVKAGQTVSVNFIVRNKPVISLLTDAVEKAFDAMRGIKTDQP